MTVKDLIEELSKLPQDMDIVISSDIITNYDCIDTQRPLFPKVMQGRKCYWKDGSLETRNCVLVNATN